MSARNVLWIAFTSTACVATALIARTRPTPKHEIVASCEQSPSSTLAPHSLTASPRPLQSRASATPDLAAASAHRAHAEGVRDVVRLRIKSVGRIVPPVLGVEAQANSMNLYLQGMVATIRQADPDLLPFLKDELADDLCGDAATDLDAMTFASLALIEPSIASGRGLSCAIEKHTKEDAVLWSLLDAWNVSGREPIPQIATIARSATDARTRDRLLPPEERQKQVSQLVEEGRRLGGQQ